MQELTKPDKDFLKKKILTAFDLNDFQVAIEKTYWHVLNEIYNQQDAVSVLAEILKIDLELAEKISKIMVDSTASKHSVVEANIIKQHKEAPSINNLEKTAVASMRTMAKDMQKVHGYGALAHEDTDEDTSSEPVYKTEQAAVLERPKMADTPTYTPDDNDPETSDEDARPSTAPATEEDARWKPRPEIQE